MTFTIIAAPQATDQLGLGIASCGMFTGGLCPFFEFGPSMTYIGTSQAFVSRSIKAKIRELLEGDGALLSIDIGEDLSRFDSDFRYRQIALIDSSGRSYVHTGSKVTGFAGHIIADDFVVIGNMLRDEECLQSMASSFASTEELPLAERLLCALEACSRAGGQMVDGRALRERAASLLVIDSGYRNVDIRVDMDAHALDRLRSLWQTYTVYGSLARACESAPQEVPRPGTQEALLPLAPSIFVDGDPGTP